MRTDRRAILLTAAALAALAALAAPAFAQVYKWVDENGRTHYGEKPPAGVKATEVGVVLPSPSPPPSATGDWKQKDLESQRQRIERERRQAAQGQREKRVGQALERECVEARRQLSRLEEQIPIYKRDSKGERVYLEDKDRPAAIAEEKRLIAENCGR